MMDYHQKMQKEGLQIAGRIGVGLKHGKPGGLLMESGVGSREV